MKKLSKLLAGLALSALLATGAFAQSATKTLTISVAPAGGGSQLYPNVGSWYILPNTAPEDFQPNFSTFPVAANCGYPCVYNDWSSAWADTLRDRLYFFGGGHGDYWGNEVYGLDVATGVMKRISNPSTPNLSNSVNADGTPNTRHTYDVMAYVGGPAVTNNPHDFVFQWSGSLAGNGFDTQDAFTAPGSGLASCFASAPCAPTSVGFVMTTSPTQGTNSFPTFGTAQGFCSAYDSIDDRIYMMDAGSFGYVDPVALSSPTLSVRQGAWHWLSTMTQVDYLQTCVVDRDNRLFIAIGDSHYYKYDLTQANPAQQVINSVSGCGAAFTDQFPLATYYPYRGVVAMLGAGGTNPASTVFLLNTVTNTCTTVPGLTNPPTISNNSGQTTGSKLFSYFPDYGVFVLGTTVKGQNSAVLRLDSGAGSGVGGGSGSGLESSPVLRASAAGNLGAQNFDVNNFLNTSGQLNNLGNCDISGETHALECFYDTSISNSGAGSMRLDCPGLTGADCSGDWNFWLDPVNHTNFFDSTHQNVDVYWQFHIRGNSQQFTTDWEALVGSSSKHFIFHQGSPSFQTCGNVEITEVQQGFNSNTGSNNKPFPTGYTQCGAVGFIDTTDSYNIPGSVSGTCNNSDPCEQQGSTTSTPYWGQHPAFTGAFRYSDHPNQWLVEYWHFHLGTPGSANSSIDAWIAPVGQPLKQFLRIRNFTFTIDAGCPGNAGSGGECFYNVLTFLLYMTAKNNSVNHPTGSVWLDELITSTGSIPAPYGPTPVPN